MAVSGVSSSRSIYGNRNVITGLASGMDTESMIENAISAYKNKISALSQKRTKTEWKQDAYRSMISKMSSFLSKYTSYRSANNLMSTSFFDQAVKTSPRAPTRTWCPPWAGPAAISASTGCASWPPPPSTGWATAF